MLLVAENSNTLDPLQNGGCTFVLMPGLHGTKGFFQHFIARAPSAYRVHPLCYPIDEKATYQTLCSWVCGQLDALSGRFVLIGESFSGPLSLLVAQQFGSRIQAVVLVATFVMPPRLAWCRYLPLSLLFHLIIPPSRWGAQVLRHLISWPLLGSVTEELRVAHPGVWGFRLRECLTVDARSALKECAAPVLYLRARRDILVPASAQNIVLETKSTVQAVEMNTSHFLLQERPDEAWKRITEFLDNILA